MRGDSSSEAIERVASALGLRVVRRFDATMFGAALVDGRGDEPLVLKASADVALAAEWATGVAMAARLRERGYPASRYVETGTAAGVTWSLQQVLPGHVPLTLTVGYAEQLIALAQRHDVDSGLRRPWDALAREASRRALAELAPLPDRFDQVLAAVLDDTADVVLAQTAVVHGDFHHRNLLVEGDEVTGVFDWEIAGPGDWRFDLVCLAFVCQMYPKTVEPAAFSTVVDAVREHCDVPVAAFLTACQTVRALSMVRAQRPEWGERASRHMQSALAHWWM